MEREQMFYENNQSISRFVKVTYMTLGSTGAIPLQRLEVPYIAMASSIHEKAGLEEIDEGAFSYATQRLPNCIYQIREILLGQSETFLMECGVPLSSWKEVFAKARRRRYLFDGHRSLVAFMSSKSDVDDIIPLLLAFQIEWNKINRKLRSGIDVARIESLVNRLWGAESAAVLREMTGRECDFSIHNYEASYCRYRKETETWWAHIVASYLDLESRPIYFVSSNTHSLINVLSGFAESCKDEIIEYAKKNPSLHAIVKKSDSSREGRDLLYYLQMKYETERGSSYTKRRIEWERNMGIYRIGSTQTLDVTAQIIDLAKLTKCSQKIATGFRLPKELGCSNALIMNIDYPLGRTAYFILNKVAEHVADIRGVYVIGKAASLFANRGDVIIPSYIVDQHTRNQYYLRNCIGAEDVIPFLENPKHGVYDNQKAVTVLGTFLQNQEMLSSLFVSGIMDIEMEAGPYLSALYEIIHPKRYPEDATVMLENHSIDIGIVHYVSDNPMGPNRLDTSLATDGVDATYACTFAVLHKIISKEIQHHA